MTSISSSTSTPSHNYKYDVFISFRGREDTRFSFTAHLYEALRHAGITAFRDDDEIREGQELKPEIERSIRESRASIIVFSENFANSSWCLDELCFILEQTRKGSHFVLPVFYKVDPSDVRNMRGCFMIEANEGVKGSKWTKKNISRWKAALAEVANLKGMVVLRYEPDFIANIVQKIHSQLGTKQLSIPAHLTGIKSRAEGINSWLKYDHPGSAVLAICGMGGSGKTTLAKHIYNSNKQNFESSSFLEEIEKQHVGLLGLQEQLLRDVSRKNILISNVSEGTTQIQEAIHMKRALIVVDDIDDPDKLTILFGTKVLPTKSKIIITTRLLNIDKWFGSISWRCRVHKLELLNHRESLKLLSWHAFGSRIPMEGFEELALQLAQYCGGNPLALKVLGSSLFVIAEDPWTRSNMKEIWKSRLNSLNSLKGDLDCQIQGVLQRSFESLPCDSHKELFLHIACLFVGEYASRVEKILENDFDAKFGIDTLINRCLITKSRNSGKLVIHNLLQDMARKIVREESKDPAKRSRVWHHDESYRLLREGHGSKTIEGLALDMREAKQGRLSEKLNTSSIVKMKNLKLLQLKYVQLKGFYENFPELRWLRWHGLNLKTLPPGLLLSSLVAIDFSFGDLEKFDPPMVLDSLKILDLSCSYKLVSICNLHRLPKLETLVLRECTELTHVCETISYLENLSFLHLARCTKLLKATSNPKFVNQLERLKALIICGGIPEQPLSEQALFSIPQSLMHLNLSGCNLEYNDFRVAFHAQSLFRLSICGNPFEILPNYTDFNVLRALDLRICPNLKSLPCLPSTLNELNISWCTSLERITFQSARFTLQVFSYEGCFKLYEIQGLFKLVPIAELEEADLGHMRWIKVYQDRKVDLVGDDITEGRTWNIQMLYEYGIRSTYLQGITDQSMTTYDHMSSSEFLSFQIPLHPKKHRIQGLNVMFVYRSSSEDNALCPPFTKISNRTKGVTWVYNPAVYCKPIADNDVVWLIYWPNRNMFDTGDEVHVNILLDQRVVVRECGASIVYTNYDEVEKEEKCTNKTTMKGEEVIGGDLSEFEVTKGGYYLCRRDFFKSRTSYWLKWLFGENVNSTDSRRWRKSCESVSVYRWLNSLRNHENRKIEVEVGVSFSSESETDKIEKAVSSVVGVESVSTHKERGRLIVCGRFDPQAVASCTRKIEKMVQILHYKDC